MPSSTLGGAIEIPIPYTDTVTFRGFLPHSELGPLLARADLLLLSSLHEGGEVVTLEAAVAGVPAVGTRVGHVAAWSPEAAVAVPVGDDEALAGAVMALLTDEDRRLAMACEAQRRAVAHDADATARRVNEIYEELLIARNTDSRRYRASGDWRT